MSRLRRKPENSSSNKETTETENELRMLQLDPEGKGYSISGSCGGDERGGDERGVDECGGDEHGCHGDRQNLTYQFQQHSELDYSDYTSGSSLSDSDEGTKCIRVMKLGIIESGYTLYTCTSMEKKFSKKKQWN